MRIFHELPGARRLVAEVDAHAADAGRMLLASLVASAAALRPGDAAVVEVAFVQLRLRAGVDEVEVLGAPDVAGGADSFAALARRIDAEQRLLRLLAVAPHAVGAAQYLRVAVDAWEAASVVGYREPGDEMFTGWQIVAATGPSGSFGQYTVRELAARKPAWCIALALPPSSAFRFVGHNLVDVLLPGGKTRPVTMSIES